MSLSLNHFKLLSTLKELLSIMLCVDQASFLDFVISISILLFSVKVTTWTHGAHLTAKQQNQQNWTEIPPLLKLKLQRHNVFRLSSQPAHLSLDFSSWLFISFTPLPLTPCPPYLTKAPRGVWYKTGPRRRSLPPEVKKGQKGPKCRVSLNHPLPTQTTTN